MSADSSIVLVILLSCNINQATLLFYDSMLYGTNWDTEGAGYLSSDPVYCASTACICMHEDSTTGTESSITSKSSVGISTEGYHRIQLQYSIGIANYESGDICRISYSVDDGNTFTPVKDYDYQYNGGRLWQLEDLGTNADDISNLRLRFQTLYSEGTDYCCIDEVSVFGTAITSNPTSTPTSSPTSITSVPSHIPSETPVVAPTESPSTPTTTSPTSAPTSGPTASSSPTGNPSESPTNKPSASPTRGAKSPVGKTRNPTSRSISPTVPPTLSPTRSGSNYVVMPDSSLFTNWYIIAVIALIPTVIVLCCVICCLIACFSRNAKKKRKLQDMMYAQRAHSYSQHAPHPAIELGPGYGVQPALPPKSEQRAVRIVVNNEHRIPPVPMANMVGEEMDASIYDARVVAHAACNVTRRRTDSEEDEDYMYRDEHIATDRTPEQFTTGRDVCDDGASTDSGDASLSENAGELEQY